MTKSPAEALLRLRDQRIKSSNPYAAWLDGYRAALAHANAKRDEKTEAVTTVTLLHLDAIAAAAETL